MYYSCLLIVVCLFICLFHFVGCLVCFFEWKKWIPNTEKKKKILVVPFFWHVWWWEVWNILTFHNISHLSMLHYSSSCSIGFFRGVTIGVMSSCRIAIGNDTWRIPDEKRLTVRTEKDTGKTIFWGFWIYMFDWQFGFFFLIPIAGSIKIYNSHFGLVSGWWWWYQNETPKELCENASNLYCLFLLLPIIHYY